MPAGPVTRSLVRASKGVRALRHVPVLKLLAVAELGLLARDHLMRLEPHERRRLFQLVVAARGRPSHLSDDERDEIADLVARMEPREFVGQSVDRFSPIPLPRRLIHGPSKRR